MSRRCNFDVRRLIVNTMVTWTMLASVTSAPAWSQQPPRGALSYGAPLAFGMNAEQVSQVLGVPLSYVRGRPGDELLLAIPNVKGSALSTRSDGLYLQFRKGRLSGWKGDWGTIRP
jgi:hypothetical protein